MVNAKAIVMVDHPQGYGNNKSKYSAGLLARNSQHKKPAKYKLILDN